MASTAAETPTTVKELKAALDAAGVKYDAKAKKPELEKLYAAQSTSDAAPAADSEPTGSSSGEGPTDLDPAASPAAPSSDGPVLQKGLIHNGINLPAGSPVPADLTEGEVTRLERLGVISDGQPAASGPRFEVFEGDGGQWYWHLQAANGEIIAQGEGFSSHGGAKGAVQAVIEAVGEIAGAS